MFTPPPPPLLYRKHTFHALALLAIFKCASYAVKVTAAAAAVDSLLS